MNLAGDRPSTRRYPYGIPCCRYREPCEATAVVSVEYWHDHQPDLVGHLCEWHLRELFLESEPGALDNLGLSPVDPDDPFLPPGVADPERFYFAVIGLRGDPDPFADVDPGWSPAEPVRGDRAAGPPQPRPPRQIAAIDLVRLVAYGVGLPLVLFGVFLAVSAVAAYVVS